MQEEAPLQHSNPLQQLVHHGHLGAPTKTLVQVPLRCWQP